MARDLKKVKTKKIILDEIELEFLNEILDYYEKTLEKKELSQLKKVSHLGMVGILKKKINNDEWTGEKWI